MSPSTATVPKDCQGATIRTRTACPARRLELTERTIQNTFDWVDPDLATGNGCLDEQLSPTSIQPEHPFTLCSTPPVTVMGRHSALLLVVLPPPKRWLPTRRRHFLPISATDLLSTSTRRIIPFTSVRLTPCRPPLRSLSLRIHACANVGPASSTAASNSRNRHLRPRVVAQFGAALTSRNHDHHCPWTVASS
jgi:hypothetical protein